MCVGATCAYLPTSEMKHCIRHAITGVNAHKICKVEKTVFLLHPSYALLHSKTPFIPSPKKRVPKNRDIVSKQNDGEIGIKLKLSNTHCFIWLVRYRYFLTQFLTRKFVSIPGINSRQNKTKIWKTSPVSCFPRCSCLLIIQDFQKITI